MMEMNPDPPTSFTAAYSLNPGIEKHEDASVFERTNETAKALLQRDDGIGNLIIEERFAAEGFDGLHAGFDNRIAGDREGQPVDDDATQLFALNIHSLPEA